MSAISEWSLRDEIEAAEKRLITLCQMVQAGQAHGGGREFERAIDAQFRSIKAHPEFISSRRGSVAKTKEG